MTHPTSFTGAPALGSHHPAPTPASAPVYQLRPTQRSSAYFPAAQSAMLSVRPVQARKGVPRCEQVSLTKELLAAIPHLKGGAPVDLVAPLRRGGTWLLNTHHLAPRRLEKGTPRFKIAALGHEHYLIAGTSQTGSTQGTVGLRKSLTFQLGPEVTEEVCVEEVDENGRSRRICQRRGTGYYELVPVR